jgi:hypothetical protein
MAVGLLPPSAVMVDDSATPSALAPAKSVASSVGDLVPVEAVDSLVPVSQTVDSLLLQRPPPAGVAAWGPRPSENSPYDQLVLHNSEEEFQLDRLELFELHARHRADPGYWTPARLADLYRTKVEWIDVLLNSTSPPVLCTVDGDIYGEIQQALVIASALGLYMCDRSITGVYDVRPFDDLQLSDAKGVAVV